MWIAENTLVEVHLAKDELLERILSPANMNIAYKKVVSNGGSAGVDGMSCDELLPYLREHKDALITSLLSGRYRPKAVRRVEIPKDNGKKRLLGIPTVVDRLIQQSIAQVLSPIYERQFSARSYGFRPRRGAHETLKQVRRDVDTGNKYAVSIDLERFFDTVSHSKLIEILSRTIKDGRVISLIHKYLNSGVMIGGSFVPSKEGTPQGGPLSPLLSNVMLNEMDKELERRGHPFVLYADDSLILCKTKRAANRVSSSIITFLEQKLLLKVNREKTKVGYIGRMKYLGYSFYVMRGKCRMCVHPESYAKMKSNLKRLTSRSNGWGYERRKRELAMFIRGWVQYYRLADMKGNLKSIDEWLRRRVRMCIWKCWKRVRTRVNNLVKCGIDKYRAWQWGNSSKKYWRIAKSPILQRAISNDALKRSGYLFLSEYYSKVVS